MHIGVTTEEKQLNTTWFEDSFRKESLLKEESPAKPINEINHFKSFLSEYGNEEKKPSYPFIDSSMNTSEGYQDYVFQALKDINSLNDFNYSLALRNPLINSDELQKEEVIELINSNRKLLLLDLDETLVHADFEKKEDPTNYDTYVTFQFKGKDITVGIILRPGVTEFLSEVSQLFNVALFTASQKEYADAILNILDPMHSIFKFRLYRENCIYVHESTYVKDLRVFKGFQLKNVILIDNSLFSFANQLSNGILITSFYHNKSDRELNNVFIYLQTLLLNANDVRTVNAEVFQYKYFAESLKKMRNVTLN